MFEASFQLFIDLTVLSLSSLSCYFPDCPVLPASRLLYWFSSHMTLWMSISFHLAITLNLLVAFFYPFGGEDEGKYHSFST